MGTRQARVARRIIRKNEELLVRKYLTKIQSLRFRDRLRFAWYIIARVHEKPGRRNGR